MKEHDDLARRFIDVMHETAVWANANPSKSGAILARELRLDPAIAQPLLDTAAKYNGFKSFPAQELYYRSG